MFHTQIFWASHTLRRLTLQLQIRFPFWLKPLPEPATPPPPYSPWKPSAPRRLRMPDD